LRQIFVDTSAWAAIEDSRDIHHEVALLFKEEIAGSCELVTTDYVLDEIYTLLLLNVGYERTVAFRHTIEQMASGGVLHIAEVSRIIREEAWRIFEQFNLDKQWSITDCTSYVVMKHLEIAAAFAFDHHFEQMGFVRKP